MSIAAVIATYAADFSQRKLVLGYIKSMMQDRHEQTVSLLSAASIEALIVEDGPVLNTIVAQAASSLPHAYSISVWNEDGDLLSKWQKDHPVLDEYLLSFQNDILFDDESFGKLEVAWEFAHQYQEMEQEMRASRVMLGVVLSLLTGVLIGIVHFLSTRHIARINSRILTLAEGDFSTELNIHASAELERLAESVNSLTEMLVVNEGREEELRRHRDHLEDLVQEKTLDLQKSKNLAEVANQTKTAFLSNVSHELRTPIHGIIAFSQLGSRKLGDLSKEKLQRFFDNINASGERLLLLVNDLLELSTLEAGKLHFNIHDNDFRHLLVDMEREFEILLQNKDLRLTTECRTQATEVPFDYDRMTQVVRNLLANAVKFSPRGGTIKMLLDDTDMQGKPVQPDGECSPALSLKICDEGVGIPEDEFEKVFEKFVQSSYTSTGSGGKGLGLAISREIVEKHRGKICASNSSLGGATLTVTLPRGN